MDMGFALVDEVFELNARNKWLRRKAVGVLQAMLQNMYGTAINKAVCRLQRRMGLIP